MGTVSLWIQRDSTMEKLNFRPSKPARTVIQKDGSLYVLWYSNSKRYRLKAGLNYIKDIDLRLRWADIIVSFINEKLKKGVVITDKDIPGNIQPPPLIDNPEIKPIKEPEVIIEKKITFFQYWRKFIEQLRNEGKHIKKATSLLNTLMRFADTEGVDDYDFLEIDKDWALRFRGWCIRELEHGINHLSGNFKLIRQVIREADIEDDIEVNKKYESKAFKVSEVDTDEIALSLADIEKIYALNLNMLPNGYEVVRDNFVVGCLTGLRYGDWDITHENLTYLKDEDEKLAALRVITKKTGERVVIPLHPMALATLKKYDFDLSLLSNQRSNKYLKEIAQLAKLDEDLILKRSKAGKIIQVKKKQWQEVKTHTARRTFVTFALFELKVDPSLLAKVTGHKSIKQLFKYARIDKEKAAIILAKYFKP